MNDAIIFLGIPFYGVNFTFPLPHCSSPPIFGDARGLLYQEKPATITLEAEGDVILAIEEEFNHHGGYFNVVGLGHGRICSFCDNYTPVGSAYCFRCGAVTEEIKYVRPQKIELWGDGVYMEQGLGPCGLNNYEPSLGSVTFTCQRDEANMIYQSVGRGLLFAHVNDPDHYLCQWCGMGVKEGQVCPGCAGVRRPMSEIVRIDRDCLYCGKAMRGNLYCDSCAARITGMTLDEYLVNPKNENPNE